MLGNLEHHGKTIGKWLFNEWDSMDDFPFGDMKIAMAMEHGPLK